MRTAPMAQACARPWLLVVPLAFGLAGSAWADPLPSWNDGATRAALVAFVEAVTTEGSAGFVPPAERIATFDNDGTLWAEQPIYFQLAFALDRIKALATQQALDAADAADAAGWTVVDMKTDWKVIFAEAPK